MYGESKEKFVNEKNLKRAHFKEAIEQIESARKGVDPSPISTQVKNGAELEEDLKTITDNEKVEPQPSKQATKKRKTADTSIVPVTTTKTTTIAANNSSSKVLSDKEDGGVTCDESKLDTDLDMDEGDDINDASKNEPALTESPSTTNEAVTSRSGRKIKPKK